MLTKERFFQTLKEYDKGMSFLDELDDLKINVYETPIFDSLGFVFDSFIITNFDEEGTNTFNWWFFENGREKYDTQGNEIPLNTKDELWEYLKEHRR